MKRIILLFVLATAGLFVNAQTKTTSTSTATKAATTKEKSTSITTPNAASTKTLIKAEELQKAITESITKDYPDYKVLKAYKLDNKNAITYEVMVEKGTLKENLFYDKDGKFLRKVNQAKPATTNTTKTSTNSKTSTTNKSKTIK